MIPMQHDDLSLVVRRLPKDVQALVRAYPNNLFIGGGFLRSVIGNEDVNDIDFFGLNRSLLDAAVRDIMSERGRQDARKIETKNAITVAQFGKTTLQFISRWKYDNAEDLIASFDFSVCQAAIWYDGEQFRGAVGDGFYPDLAAKRLRYLHPVREEEAGGSMLRVIKYVKRGYRIQMPELAVVMARVVKDYDHTRSIRIDQFIMSRMQEVDPLSIVDGLPVDEDEPVEGLPSNG